MSHINLSYVITTRNKLPYLKEAMIHLIAQKEADEEIVIIDGASCDGTIDYIKELYEAKKIEYWKSEPDHGEPHALNKGFLIARGTLIKIITDDDAFYFTGIKACKKFMLEHSEIDYIGTEGAKRNQNKYDPIIPLVYKNNYNKWRNDNTPFTFCGLGTMFRKSSIPILGLWNPMFKRADAEYTFRITSGKANIAWYTRPCFVNVSTAQSVSVVHKSKILNESRKLYQFYLDKEPELSIIHSLKSLFRKIRMIFKGKKKFEKGEWRDMFAQAIQWLETENKTHPATILFKQ